ncbi:hypothetical protein, variant [Exophiala oligosperma]|uniref:Uncharacterized protein n=1 Tax=Exophiala oligosperma TaxID=215243 RepID=A0A0D2BI81_9EURO|nr:uncharacterized protein PV06_10756 [Exophiala oligosperma]XP_016257349.1 hypothetical protein, variant [Exophiala oligosperma]KIW37132.1 hypothetical protein PV06_10756 [Exophiala oligosperma]KIW37133.1 hypothetical protein, variant [Exophiala oligosperma]
MQPRTRLPSSEDVDRRLESSSSDHLPYSSSSEQYCTRSPSESPTSSCCWPCTTMGTSSSASSSVLDWGNSFATGLRRRSLSAPLLSSREILLKKVPRCVVDETRCGVGQRMVNSLTESKGNEEAVKHMSRRYFGKFAARSIYSYYFEQVLQALGLSVLHFVSFSSRPM